MREDETITIKIGGASNVESTNNSELPPPAAASQPPNDTQNDDVIDLTANSSMEDSEESSIHNPASEEAHMTIDLVPIAKPMWKFHASPNHKKLKTAYSLLPSPLRHTVHTTTVYIFRKVRALPGVSAEYTPKAQSYIDLLRKHNPKIARDPFSLVCLKNSYAAVQDQHIPGSTSFIRLDEKEDLVKLISDALYQRLLNLRYKCEFAKREHGNQVKTIFDNKYNKADPDIRSFVRKWLDEFQKHNPNASETTIVSQPPILQTTTESATSATSVASFAPSVLSSQQRQQRFVAQQHAMLYPNTTAMTAIAAAAAATQQSFPPIYGLTPYGRYLRLQQLQLQQEKQHNQLLIEEQLRARQYQQQRLEQLEQQLLHQQQLEKQRQEERRQKEQQRQQTLKPKLPPHFPKRGRIPFANLANIYEHCWEATAQSICTADYDSDDDTDETEVYFRSLHNRGQEKTAPGIPRLPPPKPNPDLYIPVSSQQLLQCPKGLPYVKSHPPALVAVNENPFANIAPCDVVMPCEDCPAGLAQALHDLKGNRYFLRLVSEQRSAYASASFDQEQLQVVEGILQNIRRRKGVFRKVTRNKTFQVATSTEQDIHEYIRFRLKHGFPDILGDCNYTTLLYRYKKTHAKESLMLASASTVSEIEPTPMRSLVLGVEHAPLVGLVDGYLEWDTVDKSQNPKFKLSDLKILAPRKRNKKSAATNVEEDEKPPLQHCSEESEERSKRKVPEQETGPAATSTASKRPRTQIDPLHGRPSITIEEEFNF